MDALIPPSLSMPQPRPTGPEAAMQATGREGTWVRDILITRIRPNPAQPRRSFPDEEMAELAASIREHGILQPLLVKADPAGDYELVSGERRLRAAELAGFAKVPAIVVDPVEPGAALAIALVENVQRTDLNAIELACAYKRLQDEFGRTQEEIAKMVGKSRSSVTNTVRLIELPETMQDAIAEGRISAGHARALLMAPEGSRNFIYAKIIQDSLNVRQAERAARAASRQEARARSGAGIEAVEAVDVTVKAMLREMELAMESALGRKVTIQRNRSGRGRLVVEFYDDRDLEGLVERLKQKN